MGGAEKKNNRYSKEARKERRKARRTSFAVIAVGPPANGDDSRQGGYAPRQLDETVLPRPQLRPKRFGEGDDLRRYHREIAQSTAIVRSVTDNNNARRELEESYQGLELTLASRCLVPERLRQQQLELRSKTLGLERQIADQVDDNATAATDRQRDRLLADRDYEHAVERQNEQFAIAEAARKRAETSAAYAERIAQASAEAEALEQETKREKALQENRQAQAASEPATAIPVEDGMAPELAAELKEEQRRRAILKSAAKQAREIRDAVDGEGGQLSEEEQEQLDMIEQAKARALRRFDLRQANLLFDDEASEDGQ